VIYADVDSIERRVGLERGKGGLTGFWGSIVQERVNAAQLTRCPERAGGPSKIHERYKVDGSGRKRGGFEVEAGHGGKK